MGRKRTKPTPSESAQNIVNSLDANFSNDPSVLKLISFKDGLEKVPIAVIRELFKLLIGKDSLDIAPKEWLIGAISMKVQYNYYNPIFKKDIPEEIKQRTETAIDKCLS